MPATMRYPHLHIIELAILMQSEGQEEIAAALNGMAGALNGDYISPVGKGPTIKLKRAGAKLGRAVRKAKEQKS